MHNNRISKGELGDHACRPGLFLYVYRTSAGQSDRGTNKSSWDAKYCAVKPATNAA